MYHDGTSATWGDRTVDSLLLSVLDLLALLALRDRCGDDVQWLTVASRSSSRTHDGLRILGLELGNIDLGRIGGRSVRLLCTAFRSDVLQVEVLRLDKVELLYHEGGVSMKTC